MKVKITEFKGVGNPWHQRQVGSVINVTATPRSSGDHVVLGLDDLFIFPDCFEVLTEEQPAQPEPFDLDRALEGDRVITRDGKEVTDFHYFNKLNLSNYKLYGVVNGEVCKWMDNGAEICRPILDLFMAPKEPQVVTRWVNLFIDFDGELVADSKLYDSEQYNYTDAFVGSFPLTIPLKPKP